MHPYRRVDRPAEAALLRLLALAAVTAAVIAGSPVQADAHRDGCHRWHSCPSDTGSYVCGDLGYYSQCPGGAPDVLQPQPELDFTAPRRPAVGRPIAGKRGLVRIPVTAEAGSRIIVREADREIARARGSGSRQVITFRALDGVHSYVLTAMDSAGNLSDTSADVSVTADAVPPVLTSMTAQPGTSRSEASVIRFSTDPGTAFTVTVPGQPHAVRGRADETGGAEATLWLRNGRHTATVVARDVAGNARTQMVALPVAISRPALRLTRTSEDGDSPTVFTIAAPPRSTGSLRIGTGGAIPYRLDDTSVSTTVSVPLPDGRYPPVQATVTDFAGRRAAATAEAFVIDTVSPTLTVDADSRGAAVGRVALTITAEEGAEVVVDAGRAGSHRFTATSSPRSLAMDVDDGTYRITVDATDAVGNRVQRSLTVRVTHPLTVGEVILALVCLVFLLAVLIAAGILLWVQRHRITMWLERRRATAAERAVRRRYARDVAAHQQALSRYGESRRRFQLAHQAWEARRGVLAALLRTAEHDHGETPATPLPALAKAKRGERVFMEFPADLLEVRRPRGFDELHVVQTGTAVITTDRLVFLGKTRREWSFAKLVDLTHPFAGQSVLTVSNRQKPSGVAYGGPDAERIRLLIDLAAADFDGARDRVVGAVRAQLVNHDRSEPAAPSAPPPPPTPPAASGSPVILGSV